MQRQKQTIVILLTTLSLLTLSACGQKGSLYLPKQQNTASTYVS